MSEEATYATSSGLSGAGTGAMAGATIAALTASGPVGWGALAAGAAWGALAGGSIGDIGGFLGGSKAKKARKYAQKAAKIQQQREQEAYRQNLLAQIRQARISRASNLAAAVAAGTEEGSGTQAALSSIGSQISNVVEYMSVDRGRAVQYANYMAKAGKNAQSAKDIMTLTNGIIDFAGNVAQAGAIAYKASDTPNTTQSGRVSMSELPMDNGFTIKANQTVGQTTPYKPMNVKL